MSEQIRNQDNYDDACLMASVVRIQSRAYEIIVKKIVVLYMTARW